MSKSLNGSADIIKASSKVDLASWLTGGKARTKTVLISNDPALADDANVIGVRLNEIADKINAAADEDPSGSIAEDPLDDLRTKYAALLEQHEAIMVDYKASLMPFTFRAPRPSDTRMVERELKDSRLAKTTENNVLVTTHRLLEAPILSFDEFSAVLDMVGIVGYQQMQETWVELTKRVEVVDAPLLPRP